MAETSLQVQPAGTTGGGAPPAPLPMKMVLSSDGTATVLQAVALFDDQGRAVLPMTEATGQQIVRLLTQLVTMTAVSTGGFLPSDDAAGLSNTG
jgi:hypothetical protein